MIDLDAPIIPSTSAGGFRLSETLDEVLAVAKPKRTTKLSGCTKYDFGAVAVWIEDGVIAQIGVVAGYRGALEIRDQHGQMLGSLAVGSARSAMAQLGEVGRDDDENWVIAGISGVVFDVGTRIRGIYVIA